MMMDKSLYYITKVYVATARCGHVARLWPGWRDGAGEAARDFILSSRDELADLAARWALQVWHYLLIERVHACDPVSSDELCWRYVLHQVQLTRRRHHIWLICRPKLRPRPERGLRGGTGHLSLRFLCGS